LKRIHTKIDGESRSLFFKFVTLPEKSGRVFLSFAHYSSLLTFACMTVISVYTAIAEMRKLTAQGKPFYFEHFTYDRERRKASGKRIVKRALLRPAARADNLRDADHKLFYEDLEVSDPKLARRNCWQILITNFNGVDVSAK